MSDAIVPAAPPAAETPNTPEKPVAPKSPKEAALEVFRKTVAAQKQEAAPAEQPAAEAPPEKPAPNPADAELEKLNRAFRSLNKREAELRAKEDAVKEAQAKLKAYEELKAKAKLNPKAWVEHGGLEFEEIVKTYASEDGRPPNVEVLELQEKLAAMEKRLADADAQAKQRAAEQFVANYRNQLSEISKANAEKYDLITANGSDAIALALQMADTYAIENKRVPEPTQILDMLEQYLYDEQEKLFQKSKKLQQKLGQTSKEVQPQVNQGKAAPANPKKPPTLTNELQGNAPSRDAIDPRKLTGTDRVRWALQAAKRQ